MLGCDSRRLGTLPRLSVLLVKSLRDLWTRRWQTLGITLLTAAVVCATAGGPRAYRMLEHTRATWYEQLKVPHLQLVFSPTRAGVVKRAREVPGVEVAEERMLFKGWLRAERVDPIAAVVRVLPDAPPRLNALHLLRGRYPAPGEKGVVLDRSLHRLFGLDVGARVQIEVAGATHELDVLGVSLSPDHLLYPCHPEYVLPIPGTVAVVGMSRAAAIPVEKSNLVDSLLVRFEPGVDHARAQVRLLEALPVAFSAVLPLERTPGHLTMSALMNIIRVYIPAALVVLLGVAMTVLGLSLARTIQAEQHRIGLLCSLGHRRSSIARMYLPMGLVPAVVGSILGALAHGPYARHVHERYESGLGLAPLIDPGVGAELPIVVVCAVLVAAAMVLVAVFVAFRRSPQRLMRPTPRQKAIAPRALRRLFAPVAAVVRPPSSIVLGMRYFWRRPVTSLVTVVSLALAFALVLSFLAVNVTHAEGTRRTAERLGLDASVYFETPVDDVTMERLTSSFGASFEPLITSAGHFALAGGPTVLPVHCVAPDGWIQRMEYDQGRAFAGPSAREIVFDRSVARQVGVALGDRVTCYPYLNAPEGLELEVVGVFKGLSLGLVAMPLETGRDLFDLKGRATAMHVASDLAPADLIARLRALPGVESTQSLALARERMGETFAVGRLILHLMIALAVVVAALYLAVLSALDSSDRAPDLAVARALGWSSRSLFIVCLTEVAFRGGCALLLSVPLTPLIAHWLIDRIQAANHYTLDLVLEPWTFGVLVAMAAALIPLSALPAWTSARRHTPGRALKELAAD